LNDVYHNNIKEVTSLRGPKVPKINRQIEMPNGVLWTQEKMFSKQKHFLKDLKE
jgi:hypothetical protein